MKSTQEKLFDRFINLKYRMQTLAGIVQNEGMKLSEEDVTQFSEDINESINELNCLKLDVLDFYNVR